MSNQKHLRKSSHNGDYLRLALESGRMYAFEWDFRTDLVRRSAECMAVLGIPESALETTGKEFLASLHPSDRTRYDEKLNELSPAQDTYVALYRLQSLAGRTSWIEARGRGFFDKDGDLIRVIGIASDVTARKRSEEAMRKLSARLINALEEERKRFARELHDGISQSLALISIEVAQAAGGSSDPELASTLERVYGRLQDAVSDVSHISHELHPTTLKHLGLTAAIKCLCRQISESHAIDVEFTEKTNPPQTSKEVALCLYRIAQEALQNVVKHSGSRKACVELSGNSDEITLCIADEGVGFDTRSDKSGLGLVSMRERLRLVGGTIAIRSRRNFGTRVEVCVPQTEVATIKLAA